MGIRLAIWHCIMVRLLRGKQDEMAGWIEVDRVHVPCRIGDCRRPASLPV